MKQLTQFTIIAALSTALLPAAVTVTDSGVTVPTIGASDTGYTGTTNSRWGWDGNPSEGFTQTFTLANEGVIQSIFIGYNEFLDGKTVTLDLSVNGSLVESGLFLDGNNFSGSDPDDNNGVFYWMEFDLSSENIPAIAGSNSFTMTATAETGTGTGNSWPLAPRYNSNGAVYSGGALSLSFSNSTGDMAFAVTTAPIPEPSGLALIGLGALGFLARRRR